MKRHETLSVLYAEDNEDGSEMMSILLGFSKIRTTVAKTIAEAWQLAHGEKFDLFLLDSHFPDGDGLDLCRRLRKLEPLTPILFYSGYAYETDKQKGLAAGANVYLVKPESDKVAATIQQLVGISKILKMKNIPRCVNSELQIFEIKPSFISVTEVVQ